MAPIDDAHTGLDLIARLGHPVILVTGSYLGALSHTLTALAAIARARHRRRGIVVSESEQSVGLADTVESLAQFAGADVPVYALPRLTGSDEEKWRAAPVTDWLFATSERSLKSLPDRANRYKTHAPRLV